MGVQALLTRYDKRGIARLVLSRLPSENVELVAQRLHRFTGATILIATGFFVNGRPETDGPPGAVTLARSLTQIGCRVVLVSRKDGIKLMKPFCDFNVNFAEFPVTKGARALRRATSLLNEFNPRALIAIEVCGPTRSRLYCDMKGADISSFTPPLDILFTLAADQRRFTVGIGDGGNEIGFGNVPPSLLRKAGVAACVTKTSALIVASVSNWGAYALVFCLSRLCGRNLLPPLCREREVVKGMVKRHAVDGFSGRNIPKVDGRSLDEHEKMLRIFSRRFRHLQ